MQSLRLPCIAKKSCQTFSARLCQRKILMKSKSRPIKPPKVTKKTETKILRIYSAWNDMREAVVAGELLLSMQSHYEGVPDDLSATLFNAMICAYARPFTSNDGLGRIQDDYKTYPDFDPQRHARLLELRHNFGSHSNGLGSGIKVFLNTPLQPGEPAPAQAIGFAFGKRRFAKSEYVAWLLHTPRVFQSFLYSELTKLLTKTFAGTDMSKEVVLGEGIEDYQFKGPVNQTM